MIRMGVFATAIVDTESAARRLGELCEHLEGKAAARPEVHMTVERAERHALVDLGWARCELRAEPRRLVVRIEADDAEGVQALSAFLTHQLRDLDLTVGWDAPGGVVDLRAGMRAFHRRARGASRPAPAA